MRSKPELNDIHYGILAGLSGEGSWECPYSESPWDRGSRDAWMKGYELGQQLRTLSLNSMSAKSGIPLINP